MSRRRRAVVRVAVAVACLALAVVGCDSDPGTSAKPCAGHADCGEAGLCVKNACRKDFVVTLETALVGTSYGDDGLPWDPKGDGKQQLPDPFATLQIDGVEVCRTNVVMDTEDPQWKLACPVQLNAGTELRFEVQDADQPPDSPGAAESDPMYLKYVKGAELALGRSGNEHQNAFMKLEFKLSAP